MIRGNIFKAKVRINSVGGGAAYMSFQCWDLNSYCLGSGSSGAIGEQDEMEKDNGSGSSLGRGFGGEVV